MFNQTVRRNTHMMRKKHDKCLLEKLDLGFQNQSNEFSLITEGLENINSKFKLKLDGQSHLAFYDSRSLIYTSGSTIKKTNLAR